MALAAGTRLGAYEITGAIGAGGMGEVYRAKDTKLNRDVAIKVLPDVFANDADRLARFTREAQTLASLNHPNIAAIYGIEDHAIVMELVEGRDLSEIIAAGSQDPALHLKDVIAIARQIAEALEAAHDAGIIHRDLKPANIKVRADGTVKVLDFGLAKAMEPAGGTSASAANSPTLTAHATQMGMIIGTAAYMSPEQARGKAADKRADIWAFGVVLYEMLTGRRTFEGGEISDVLAAVLRQDIDWTALPAGTPLRLRRLLERCLDRDAKTRLRDIGEARVEIAKVEAGAPESGISSTAAAPPAPTPVWLIAAIAAVTLAAGLVAGRWMWSERGQTAPSPAITRLEIVAGTGVTEVHDLAMAADGSFVVFSGISGSTRQLYLRRLDDLTLRPLDGTDGAELPFVSHDGKWIGFFRANHLEKIAVSGGESVPIAKVSTSNPGSAWGPDNTIVLTTSWYGGLSTVSASGGDPRALTTLDAARGERGHWYPQFLPDGRHVLFTIWKAAGGLNDSEIGVLDLSTGTRKVIMAGAYGSYVAPGFLVFYRAGAYQAVRFDLQSLTSSGDSVTVLTEDRGITPDGSNPTFTAASNGTIAYVPGQYYATQTLAWIAEGGAVEPLSFTARSFRSVALAPNGGRLAAGAQEGGRYVVRLLDLDRHTDDALELPGSNWVPTWSPDGRRLALRTLLKGDFDIYAKDVTTSAPPVLLLSTPGDETPLAWLAEKKLVITQEKGDGLYRTKLLDLDAPDRPQVLSEYNADSLSASPDGRWLAMADVHSGRSEIYVRRAEGEGVLDRISSGGGTMPRWLHNGHDLLYVRGQDIIVRRWREEAGRVKVEPERVWAHLGTGDLLNLFEAEVNGRVLIGIRKDATMAPQVRVVLNWQEELARKLAR